MSPSVADLRARILAFLVGKPPTCQSDIREHLGLDPLVWLPRLNQALKSCKIRVTKVHPQIGINEGVPFYSATPISLYSLITQPTP